MGTHKDIVCKWGWTTCSKLVKSFRVKNTPHDYGYDLDFALANHYLVLGNILGEVGVDLKASV